MLTYKVFLRPLAMRGVFASRSVLIALCAVLAVPAAALADSDGYYCVGPDYLAYQFGLGALPIASHRLSIVRLTSAGILADTVRFDLPQFQVHGMICDARTIRIAAYDAIYTVQLDEARRPTSFTKSAAIGSAVPIEMVRAQRNLAGLGYSFDYRDWGKTVRRALLTGPDAHAFVLEFVPDSVKPTHCTTQVTTTVLELDATGRVLRSRRVFRGPAYKACGE